VHGGLEGAVEAVGAAFAADDGAASARGDLDVLAVLALAAVAFVLELDVEAVDRAIEPLEASELLCDIDAVVVGDLDVAASHLDFGAAIGVGGFVGVGQLIGVHGLC